MSSLDIENVIYQVLNDDPNIDDASLIDIVADRLGLGCYNYIAQVAMRIRSRKEEPNANI